MDADWLKPLNAQQRAAATCESGPLLIVAGAGTGKTNTLAYRVAYLIERGIDPARILLLTFTRRAASEMLKRVESVLPRKVSLAKCWGGTFHAVANRLLRIYGKTVALNDTFTVMDRSDAEDLMHSVRAELRLDRTDVRFPQKSTCLAIYSRCVNASQSVEEALRLHYPWCMRFPRQLRELFKAYTLRKQADNVLDYDDLLLYWLHLMQCEAAALEVRGRFDAVLVDEHQDTNALQAAILKHLCPGGRALTVVGDDAQSIYSFRAATVHNILQFPQTFPNTTILKLEHNYRSVQPILDAANAVIAQSPTRYDKNLFSTRTSDQKPRLVTLVDEDQQSDYVIQRILEHHEAGILLRKQAVLFRAAHHSDALEVQLGRRGIPFVKYGGLRFLEAAHVKDVLSILRLAENPTDSTSGLRVLLLIDGIGPAQARRALRCLHQHRGRFDSWLDFSAPPAASRQWRQFVPLMRTLHENSAPLPEQIALVKNFYAPILEKRYEQPDVRKRDLDQLQQISGSFRSRSALLSELVLDPPTGTQDLAAAPFREQDYLILSTIHSAKGCEWDVVYVIHAADGNIPSDLATGSEEEIEEERRLFYVALTRARDFLEVCLPLRYYAKKWTSGDRHSYAQLTRFIPQTILDRFERVNLEPSACADASAQASGAVDIRSRIAAMWGLGFQEAAPRGSD